MRRSAPWSILFLVALVASGCGGSPPVAARPDVAADAPAADAPAADVLAVDAAAADVSGADGAFADGSLDATAEAGHDGGLDGDPLDGGPLDGATPEAGHDAGDASDATDVTPVCAPGQVLCDGRCVDTASEPAHCGACGRACLVGQRCVDGGCECLAGQSLCAGACVTTAADRAHCGGCGRACPAAQSCVAGTCRCPSGQTLCGAACVDATSDLAHCGGCGRACPAGQLCNGGTCGVTCSAPRVICGTGATMACVDPATSPAHCGGCGRACPAAQSCVAGTCQCAAGQALCGDACVTTATDRAHCGVCGRACPAAQSCVAGACQCPPGQALCGDACVDTASDRANCGACGAACPAGQSCVAGACGVPCSAPRVVCGAGAAMACVDPVSDRAHCGGCGRVCPTAQSCVGGTCACPSGQTLCGAACVDASSDRANCGVCGRACPSAQSCVAGACQCPTGQTLCGGACVATATDSAHCGGCDRACPAVQGCVAGACQCATGRTFCSGACVDATTDLAHCGGCGRACPVPTLAAATCAAGTCGFACVPTTILVGGACTPVAPPRQVAPLSTSTVTSRRPTLRWALAAGGDGARVQLCRDRACATVLATLDAAGTSAAPATDLPTGVVFWRLLPRMGGATGTATSATWEFTVGERTAPRDTSWGTTPDVNGDGLADVLVGGYQWTQRTGRLYVFLGRTAGLGPTPTTTIDGPDGEQSSFGYSVASAGDVNGDGFADVIVGAPFFGPGGNTGRAYLILGGATGLATTPALTLTARDGAYGRFGQSVASAGDVNGDGYADVLVGAPRVETVAGRFGGRAYLYLGTATGPTNVPATTFSVSESANLGWSVASAGDVNGDGFADIVIGDSGSWDHAFLYQGSATGPSTTPTTTLDRPGRGDGMSNPSFGQSVASAGDVNGDGFADVVIGAYGMDSRAGRAFVYLGSATGLGAVPATDLPDPTATSGDQFGQSVAGVGDVNGDGFADVLIDIQRSGPLLYLGSATGLNPVALRTLAGTHVSIAGAGDINGDGFADVLTGYEGNASIRVYAGSATGPAMTATTVIVNGDLTSYFGFSLASAGDLGRALRPWFRRARRPAAGRAGGPA